MAQAAEPEPEPEPVRQAFSKRRRPVVDFLHGLLWNMSMMRTGECPDYGYAYSQAKAPSFRKIRDYLEAQPNLSTFELPSYFATEEPPLQPLVFCLSVSTLGSKAGMSPALQQLMESPSLADIFTDDAVIDASAIGRLTAAVEALPFDAHGADAAPWLTTPQTAYYSRLSKGGAAMKPPTPPSGFGQLTKKTSLFRFVVAKGDKGRATAAVFVAQSAETEKVEQSRLERVATLRAAEAVKKKEKLAKKMKEKEEREEKARAKRGEPPLQITPIKVLPNAKLMYDAVHTTWRGKMELSSDGSFRRIGKDGGDWWCEDWEGKSAELVLSWEQWPAERMATADGGKSFLCAGHTLWQGQQEDYSFEMKLPGRSQPPGWIRDVG